MAPTQMQRYIFRINIANELDIVLAYRRAMQLSERLKIALANQTKFATAVSEICRNVVEYVGSGTIKFSIVEQDGFSFLEALISDRGRGIGNLNQILGSASYDAGSRGSGILNSKKLVDFFDIESGHEKGTSVTLRKRIPPQSPTVSKELLALWVSEFDEDTNVSPYEEIKRQNMQLLELLDQLRLRNLEAEEQLLEIRRLNNKLHLSNKEISELLQEREKKNDLLEQINKDLDAFAHTVSHDLRAPLQNINGLTTALEACLEAEQLEEAIQVVFPMLRQQTSKMDRLITSILAYSLAGHHNIKKSIVDLQTLLHHVITSLDVPASFKIELEDQPPLLYTQEIYLYQVFSNIIGNAIKYHDNPQQGVLKIEHRVMEDYLQFSVQDNGPGIAPDVQEMIFDMYEMGGNFSRTDSSSGLGLSIVKKIVTEKGGSVWVKSEGRGSCFYFTWPLIDLVTETQP